MYLGVETWGPSCMRLRGGATLFPGLFVLFGNGAWVCIWICMFLARHDGMVISCSWFWFRSFGGFLGMVRKVLFGYRPFFSSVFGFTSLGSFYATAIGLKVRIYSGTGRRRLGGLTGGWMWSVNAFSHFDLVLFGNALSSDLFATFG